MNGNPTDWCGNMWEYTKSKTKKSLVLFLTHEMTRIKSLSISAASQTLALLLGEMWWTALWDHNWPYLASLGHKTVENLWGFRLENRLQMGWIFVDFHGFSLIFGYVRWFSLIFHIDVYKFTRLSNCWIFWRPVFVGSSAIPLHDVSTKDQRVSVQRATTGLPPAYHEFFFQDIT